MDEIFEIFEIIKIATRNVARNRRRSLITAGMVAIGLAAVVFCKAYLTGVQVLIQEGVVEGRTGALQIQHLGYGASQDIAPLDLDLPESGELADRARAVANVEALSPRLNFIGMISNGESSTMFAGEGVDPLRERAVCPLGPGSTGSIANKGLLDHMQGPGFDGGDANAVVLGTSLAESLRVKIGQTVTLLANTRSGSMDALDLPVVGIYNAYDPFVNKHLVVVPLKVAQRLLHMPGRVTAFAARLREASHLDETAGELRTLLGAAGADTEVHTGLDLLPFYRDVIVLEGAILDVVTGIVLALVLAGVINTMLMSVFERTREIGTLMSVGFRRRRLVLLFLIESVALGAIGGAVGAALGSAIVVIAHHHGVPFYVPAVGEVANRPVWSGPFLLWALVGTFLAAVLGGLYPAYRASRLRPVEALQGT